MSGAIEAEKRSQAIERELVEHARDFERLVRQLETVQEKLHRLTGATTAATLHAEMLVGASRKSQISSDEATEQGVALRKALEQVRVLSEELKRTVRIVPPEPQVLVQPEESLKQVVAAAQRKFPRIHWRCQSSPMAVSFNLQGGELVFRQLASDLLTFAGASARSTVDVSLRFVAKHAQVGFEVTWDSALVTGSEPIDLRSIWREGERAPLYDACRLVRRNGGRLTLESDGIEKTMGRVLLPYAAPQSDEQEQLFPATHAER